jgi:hypothetical protein
MINGGRHISAEISDILLLLMAAKKLSLGLVIE